MWWRRWRRSTTRPRWAQASCCHVPQSTRKMGTAKGWERFLHPRRLRSTLSIRCACVPSTNERQCLLQGVIDRRSAHRKCP